MKSRWRGCNGLGSARAARAGDRALASGLFLTSAIQQNRLYLAI